MQILSLVSLGIYRTFNLYNWNMDIQDIKPFSYYYVRIHFIIQNIFGIQKMLITAFLFNHLDVISFSQSKSTWLHSAALNRPSHTFCFMTWGRSVTDLAQEEYRCLFPAGLSSSRKLRPDTNFKCPPLTNGFPRNTLFWVPTQGESKWSKSGYTNENENIKVKNLSSIKTHPIQLNGILRKAKPWKVTRSVVARARWWEKWIK